MATIGTPNHNEWQKVIQRVITNGNEWYNEWKRMTVNESEFGFTTKQNIHCITTIYSAIYWLCINWEIDDIYFQYNILCFYHASNSLCFLLSVLMKFI